MAAEHYEAEITRLTRELEKWKTEARQAKRDHEKSEITWRMREAGRSAGVAETALDDVVARALNNGEWGLDSKGRLRRLVNGGPEVEIDGSFVSPTTWIKSQRPHSPHWFADASAALASEPSATAPIRQSLPAGGKNPFAKETWNMTEQGRIYKQSPQLAQQMAEAAGRELVVDVNNKKRW